MPNILHNFNGILTCGLLMIMNTIILIFLQNSKNYVQTKKLGKTKITNYRNVSKENTI